LQALNPGRVKHDADSLADGLGGEVLGELGSDGAASAMGTRHFAPDDPKLVSFVIRSGNAGWLLSLVNVGTLLAEVKVSVAATRHSLKSEECGVLMLTAQSTLVASEDGFDVKTARGFYSAGFLDRDLFHGSIDFGNFRHVYILFWLLVLWKRN